MKKAKITFVIGANEGVFPETPTNGGLFNDDECIILSRLDIKIADDINEMNLSENYFCDLFHKVMGQKYNRYLNDLKLKYAYNLVVSSDASVTDICFASGFESLSHFQKEFRTRYGCCARDLRKSKRPI